MLVEVNFSNPKLLAYAMKIRIPKLIVMLITAFSIGGASLVFQSIINNTIVTPCLLGMNSLYTLIHTAVVFFLGSASVVASNANLSFAVDVVLMGITATIIYSWIFKKTKHNVLYVLLVGTVLTSFFSSIQTKQHQETKGRSRLGACNRSPDLWERPSVFLLIAEIWDLITVHPLLLNLRFSEFFIFPPLHSSSFSPQTP